MGEKLIQKRGNESYMVYMYVLTEQGIVSEKAADRQTIEFEVKDGMR